VPGERLEIVADLCVDALLLPAQVQVAQPQFHLPHLGDHTLIDGRDAIAGRVEPVHPQKIVTKM
jgi:hypothetical protein